MISEARVVELWEAVRALHPENEDLAQEFVVRVLAAGRELDIETTLKSIQNKEEAPGRIQEYGERHLRPVNEPLPEGWEDWAAWMGPEEVLLLKEEFKEFEQREPHKAQQILDGKRKAECHPLRNHKAHGLCSPCYREGLRRGIIR